MSEPFRAIRVNRNGSGQTAALVELNDTDLMAGDVTIHVEHSSVNYKDGLAITGNAPVIRRFPMIPGIDLAGRVVSSTDPGFKQGERVVLNGYGIGESHFGGFAQRARVKGEWLIKLPSGITTAQAMAIGTAGYTAALAVLEIGRAGLSPERGPILVTGAAGGVGSVAIALLSQRGYHVVASSRRARSERDYLISLGAADTIDAAELAVEARPLGKERWAAALDSVGSRTLANVIASTTYGGVVCACGLAQGADLPVTVMPFIMRGIRLIGIDSVMAPMEKRRDAWRCLERELDFFKLQQMTKAISLDEVVGVASEIVTGQIRGRVIVYL